MFAIECCQTNSNTTEPRYYDNEIYSGNYNYSFSIN